MAKGAAFEAEIQRSAALLPLYYKKIVVPLKLARIKGKPVLVKLASPPYDGFIVHEGRHIALEMKSTAVHTDFPLSRIEDHQVVGLTTMLAWGCAAYILFNSRWEMRDGKKKLNNRCWAFSMQQWSTLHHHLCDRKSIPAALFDDPTWFTPLPRLHLPEGDGKKALCWDLRQLLVPYGTVEYLGDTH